MSFIFHTISDLFKHFHIGITFENLHNGYTEVIYYKNTYNYKGKLIKEDIRMTTITTQLFLDKYHPICNKHDFIDVLPIIQELGFI